MFGRRSFLKRLLGGAVGVAAAATAGSLLNLEALDGAGAELLDPERKLWTPGRKSFFFPDDQIAIKNIRQATPQEIAQVTGQHMVRLKYTNAAPKYLLDARGRTTWIDEDVEAVAASKGRMVEEIVLMSEDEFIRTGPVAFKHAKNLEVHFDNGTVAYHFKAGDAKDLKQIKAQVDAQRRLRDERRRIEEAEREKIRIENASYRMAWEGEDDEDAASDSAFYEAQWPASTRAEREDHGQPVYRDIRGRFISKPFIID